MPQAVKNRSPPEVTQFADVELWVTQKVLGLDVAVANSNCVNVCQRATHLVQK